MGLLVEFTKFFDPWPKHQLTYWAFTKNNDSLRLCGGSYISFYIEFGPWPIYIFLFVFLFPQNEGTAHLRKKKRKKKKKKKKKEEAYLESLDTCRHS